MLDDVQTAVCSLTYLPTVRDEVVYSRVGIGSFLAFQQMSHEL